MALSSPGIGSGLDVNSLVSKLMSVEQQPLVDLSTKEASFQSKISAYGSFQGMLSTLQGAVTSLSSASLFSAFSTSASTASYFTSSASSTASAGSYSLSVTALAQSHKLATNAYVDTTTAIGTGNITFQYGTYNSGTNTYSVNGAKPTQTVAIDAAHSSLSGIRDAINAANIAVSASITNDGTGFRLVLTSKDSGVANSLNVSVDNASLSALTYDPLAAGVKNLTQTMAAQNAALTLDGMALSKASNTITDAIQGVTLTLTQTTVAPVSMTVARDTASIQSSVTAFVNAYNAAQTGIKSLSAYNATNNTGSVLTGDATLRTIQNQMRSILNTPLTSAGGGLTSLSDIGVSFQKNGTLTVNSTKLATALADPSKDISTLFASVGKPTDSLVKFGTATAATLAGNYAVNITQAASQGTLSGSAAPATPPATSYTITALTNDTLTMAVDGISATVTLAAGTYTPTALAAQVQSQINGATALSSAGVGVSVGYIGTQGNAVGSAVAGLTINGTNNTVNLTVDGTAITATLASGTYTASTLAAEAQNKINAALAIASPGKSLVVSTSNSGVMTLNSDSYGATSSVSVTGGNGVLNLLGTPVSTAGTGTGTMLITSTHYGSTTSVTATGNAVATLLGGAPVSTAGTNVAGTIGGQGATGVGQALTGTAGNATGLTLTIAGTATGSRGTVAYASGYASQLAAALTSMTATTGTVASRINGIQNSIAAIGKQRDVVSRRLTGIEARYRAQFTALDLAVSSMNSTSSFLSQQLTSLANNPINLK